MNEDVFIGTMQDFYSEYRGRRASTRDFQRIVEQHLGSDMSWFFDEWVRGNAIPKYVFSWRAEPAQGGHRSEEHTSELQSQSNLVWRLLLEKNNDSADYS